MFFFAEPTKKRKMYCFSEDFVLSWPRRGEEAMKKWAILLSIFVCLVLILAINCKSPASSEAASPFIAADAESNSGSNSGNNAGSGGGSDGTSGDAATSLGSFIIKMKDKPVTDADQVWVKISNIVVHMADPDEFIEVSDVEQNFDLLELKNNPVPIVSADLEAGHYNQIRMDVVEGSIVFLEDDGQGGLVEVPYDLKIPSNEIKIPVQFYIEAGGETQIILDFDAEESIKVTQQGKKDSYKLRPVIRIVGVSYE
jgi:hypothetical protein